MNAIFKGKKMIENVLSVTNLTKDYGNFKLDNVSFNVKKGEIMGFIGRNGAGKTTTLRSMLNFTKADSGSVEFFGLNYKQNEKQIKQDIGYASGGVNYYHRKKLGAILKVTSGFYENWDDKECEKYIKLFNLDLNKRLMDLSEGMKVKFNLTIALSHHAKLLILDEPTSGLDPVSRDELLEVFLHLVKNGVTIFFSTHITSDLDKCADSITYIKNGKILSCCNSEQFISNYALINLSGNESQNQINAFMGVSNYKDKSVALIKTQDSHLFNGYAFTQPTLEDIMVNLEKGVKEDV